MRKLYPIIGTLLVLAMAPGCGDDDDDDTTGSGGSGGPAAGVGGSSGAPAAGTGGAAGTPATGGTGGEPGTGGTGGEETGGTGGIGGTGGAGAEVDPAFHELPAKLAGALCTSYEACVGTESLDWGYGQGKCTEVLTGAVQDSNFVYIADSLVAGRGTFDPGQVDGCIAYIAGLGCNLGTTRYFSGGACAGVFTGTVEEGGACADDVDCVGNLYCNTKSACPGACTALSAAGGICDGGGQCQDGLSCNYSTGLCAAPVPVGGQCDENTGRCTMGLLCVRPDPQQPGTCMTREQLFVVPNGQPCDPSNLQYCVEEAACIITWDGVTAHYNCGPLVASGAPCNLSAPDQCPFGEYCAGLDPDAQPNPILTGTCGALPGDGAPCTAEGDCGPGLFCDTDNLCHGMNRLDGPCVSDDGCASGSCEANVCVRPPQCVM